MSIVSKQPAVRHPTPAALLDQPAVAPGGDHRDAGKPIAIESNVDDDKLHLSDRFQHLIFEGGHEFDDESAWGFVGKHL